MHCSLNKWISKKKMCCIFVRGQISPMNQQKFQQWTHNSMRSNGSTQTNWIWFWYLLVCGLCIPQYIIIWSDSVSLNQFEWPKIQWTERKMFDRRPNSSHHMQMHNRIRWCYCNGHGCIVKGCLDYFVLWTLCHYDSGYPHKKMDFEKLFIVSVINQWQFSLSLGSHTSLCPFFFNYQK